MYTFRFSELYHTEIEAENGWCCVRSPQLRLASFTKQQISNFKVSKELANTEIIYFFYLVFYQDPTNLQGKIQKHQAFEAELNANQSRLDAVDSTGEQLIADDHYASDQIRERLDELHKLWAYLFERSNDKG